MMIYPVPEVFQAPDRFLYPEDNWPDFEYWFMKNVSESDFSIYDRVYLPILFTSYFKREQYGKNKSAIDLLQRFVDSLPSDKKYFTIVQYDDGTLIDWKDKDVSIFSMSGKPFNSIQIPLICQPHKYKFDNLRRDILFSFIGRITDPMRQKIVEWGKTKSTGYVSIDPRPLENYCAILARSRYVLCPRGYGASSFRVCEALQYGAEPIVFTNEEDRTFERMFYPGMFFSGVLDRYVLDGMHAHMLSNANQPMFPYQPGSVYEEFYTFEAVKKIIYRALWDIS